MKVHYDPDVDILYIVVKNGPAVDSRDADDNIILELGKDGKLMGIQVLHARSTLVTPLSKQIAAQISPKKSGA